MESVIHLENACKDFKVLNRREGLKGSFKDLFSRDYKVISAVKDISLDIKKGEIVGYLGTNGAGKSTTIKMMTGVLEPSAGTITVNGKIPHKNRAANAQNIGVVFGQRSQLWWALPVIESFKLLKDIYRIPDQEYKDMMEFYESLVDIKVLYDKPVRQMSLGQRTLSDILAAFLHNPAVVFLDEPTIGLDVSMKGKIRELIKAVNKKKQTTVILTTHDMGDVDALCRRIIIIDKGQMLYDNSIENLKGFFGAYRTLKLQFGSKFMDEDESESTKKALSAFLHREFSQAPLLTVSADKEWVSVLVNEEEVEVLTVLNKIQEFRKVSDIKMDEISTESVIKKIYEGGI
ncbi:MAG TPA: ATP-binding cassette domain-containing protein [Mobilitalea sp.]|nr:ATP-binding cassette domain-containing protein [Mobilitalea sp.]